MAIAEAAAQLLQQRSTEISAAEAAAEIERNYATMAQLKDDRIARLEEMLAHAHATLEHGENNRSDVLEYSETRRLKAELARRDEVCILAVLQDAFRLLCPARLYAMLLSL
jgi:hypothetical protein